MFCISNPVEVLFYKRSELFSECKHEDRFYENNPRFLAIENLVIIVRFQSEYCEGIYIYISIYLRIYTYLYIFKSMYLYIFISMYL